MPGDLPTPFARFSDAWQEQLGLQGIVGDFDKIDFELLQGVQRLLQLGGGSNFQITRPDGFFAFQFGAGGEYSWPYPFTFLDFLAPLEHRQTDVARAVAYSRDAHGQEKGQELFVFVDEGIATKMDVVVPKAGHEVLVFGKDDLFGLGQLALGWPNINDAIALDAHDLIGQDFSGGYIDNVDLGDE